MTEERKEQMRRLASVLESLQERKLERERFYANIRFGPNRWLLQNGWQPGDYWHEFDQGQPDHWEPYR